MQIPFAPLVIAACLAAASPAAAEDEGAPVTLPEPEVAWIVENSVVGDGGARDDRLEFDVEQPAPGTGTPSLAVPGIDTEFGDRVLNGPPQVEVAPPASLLGF